MMERNSHGAGAGKRSTMANKLFAIIRIRGKVGISRKIEDTMKLLRLHKKNRCALVFSTKDFMGMLSKVKDYTTFGEVDADTVALLLEKRGRITGDIPLTEEYLKKHAKMSFKEFAAALVEGKKKLSDIPGLKQYFKLHPPVGGFEREGIKKPYTVGGALGYRKDEINRLVRRMV